VQNLLFLVFPFGHDARGILLLLVVSLLGPWLLAWLPPLVVRVRLPGIARGMALPALVLVEDPADDGVLRHEFAHIQQMRRWSPLLLAGRVGWHYAWELLVRRRSFLEAWTSNPIERQAERARRGEPGWRLRPGLWFAVGWRNSTKLRRA